MSANKGYLKIFFLLLISNNLYAADLVDVYNRAIQYNDDYRIIKNDREISLQQYNQTAASIFPEINLQVGTRETTINKYIGPGDNTNFNTDSYSLTLQQPIFRLAFFDELAKSDAVIKRSEKYLALHKKRIALKTTELYFRLISHTNNLRAKKELLKLSEKKLNNAHKLYSNGSITKTEFLKYKSNVESSRIARDMAKNEQENSSGDLYVFVGKKISDIHNINTEIEITDNQYELTDVLNQATSKYEIIQMANYDLDISQNIFESNKSQHFPRIDLIASYDYSDITGGARFGANKTESSSVGLTLTLPIYQGGYQSAKVKESRYKLENAQIKYEQTLKILEKEVADKISKHRIQKGLVNNQREIYKLNNLKYISAKEGFRAGIYTDTELQQSKIELIQAKNSFVDATLNFILLDLDIKQYTSQIGIDEIKEINSILVW